MRSAFLSFSRSQQNDYNLKIKVIMKTALQDLIEDLNREIDNCERNGLQYRGIYLDARWKAENLLEKEKKQIAEAYEKGTEKGINDGGEDAENYYDQNFYFENK